MGELAGHLTQMFVLGELIAAADRGMHCLTLDELAERITHPRKVIVNKMQRLMEGGLVKTVRVACYAPTPKGHARHREGGEIKSGPKPGGGRRKSRVFETTAFRQRAWKAIRILNKATVSEILQCAMIEGEDDRKCRASARLLLRQLCNAGYVAKMPRRRRSQTSTSNGDVIYYLLRNTGALCPAAHTPKRTTLKGLLDRNTEEFFEFGNPQATPKAVGAAS